VHKVYILKRHRGGLTGAGSKAGWRTRQERGPPGFLGNTAIDLAPKAATFPHASPTTVVKVGRRPTFACSTAASSRTKGVQLFSGRPPPQNPTLKLSAPDGMAGTPRSTPKARAGGGRREGCAISRIQTVDPKALPAGWPRGFFAKFKAEYGKRPRPAVRRSTALFEAIILQVAPAWIQKPR